MPPTQSRHAQTRLTSILWIVITRAPKNWYGASTCHWHSRCQREEVRAGFVGRRAAGGAHREDIAPDEDARHGEAVDLIVRLARRAQDRHQHHSGDDQEVEHRRHVLPHPQAPHHFTLAHKTSHAAGACARGEQRGCVVGADEQQRRERLRGRTV